MPELLTAPFPWFGGKTRAAALIWERFGNPRNYVEPFAGSLAVLLQRPHEPNLETVNDLDCFVSNFWRALAQDPNAVASAADYPINEADLHARHTWLVSRRRFRERMLSEPHYYDAKIAGWWAWGLSMWIGSGWCEHPEWRGRGHAARAPRGMSRQKPTIGRGPAGREVRGIPRQKPHIDNSTGRPKQQRPHLSNGQGLHSAAAGIDLKRPVIANADSRGVVKMKRPHINSRSTGGVHRNIELFEWLEQLANRLRFVRVCCGDWKRVVTPSVTWKVSGDATTTGILLDPPYDLTIVRSKEAGSDGAAPSDKLYQHHDSNISADVRAWAIENGRNKLLRIALCGYAGEHEMPDDWECVAWKANGGYGNQRGETKSKENSQRERIWFSPHCLKPGLFAFNESGLEIPREVRS